jgi:hypothetical protein
VAILVIRLCSFLRVSKIVRRATHMFVVTTTGETEFSRRFSYYKETAIAMKKIVSRACSWWNIQCDKNQLLQCWKCIEIRNLRTLVLSEWIYRRCYGVL